MYVLLLVCTFPVNNNDLTQTKHQNKRTRITLTVNRVCTLVTIRTGCPDRVWYLPVLHYMNTVLIPGVTIYGSTFIII